MRWRHLPLPLALLFAGGCTVLNRGNPQDPGSLYGYRPHFSRLWSVAGPTGAASLWSGRTNLVVQGLGSGLSLSRYDATGALQVSTNLSLPLGPGLIRIAGLEMPGTNRILVATNHVIVLFDLNFNEVGTKAPYPDGNAIVDMAAGFTSDGGYLFISRNVAPYFVRDGIWNNSAPLGFPINGGPWIGVARGTNGVDGPPTELVAVVLESGTSNSPARYHILRYEPTNGSAILEHAIQSVESTLDGIPYRLQGLPAVYGGNVYFLAATATSRSLIRQRRGRGMEWVILDPDFAANVLAFQISESGKLAVLTSDRLLLYAATGY